MAFQRGGGQEAPKTLAIFQESIQAQMMHVNSSVAACEENVKMLVFAGGVVGVKIVFAFIGEVK